MYCIYVIIHIHLRKYKANNIDGYTHIHIDIYIYVCIYI